MANTRLCVEYQKLNVMTHSDAYPLPRVQDCLDAMAGSGMFFTMNILLAYSQVPMTEKHIPKTALTTKYGLLSPTMPFGLITAPAIYWWLLEIALSGL